MLAGLSNIWKRVALAGTDGLEDAAGRRVVLCNQMGMIGVVFTIGYNFLYSMYDFAQLWPVVCVNLVAIWLYALIPVMSAKRRYSLAKFVTLGLPCFQVFLVTIFVGRDAGIHLFLFDAGMLACLIAAEKEKTMLIFFLSAPAALFVVAQYGFPSEAAPIQLPQTIYAILYIGTSVSVFVVLAGFILVFHREIRQAESLLKAQYQRSEKLLLNILPGPIAERLKAQDSLIADSFPEVTVLFADIVGFTPLSAKLPAEELVALLSQLFSRFDAITEKHGLEKIKTIGDAYMLAGGLPLPREDHAVAVALAALELQREIESFNIEQKIESPISLRIGIHSGPVVAGVIGTRKFAYDVWGDTVNTASRMESHSEPGAIQVSSATFELLKHDFNFLPRGEVPVKGKGNMYAWFLMSQKTRAERPRLELVT